MSFVLLFLQVVGLRKPDPARAAKTAVAKSKTAGVNIRIVMSNEERDFVRLHAPLLQSSTADQTMALLKVVREVWRKVPIAIKVLIIIMYFAFMIIVLPLGLFMLFNAFSSLVVIAKFAMLLVLLICILIGKVLMKV